MTKHTPNNAPTPKYIKADVLDKIRAEIQSEQNDILWRYNDYDDGRSEALEWVLNVIDKYTGVRE